MIYAGEKLSFICNLCSLAIFLYRVWFWTQLQTIYISSRVMNFKDYIDNDKHSNIVFY